MQSQLLNNGQTHTKVRIPRSDLANLMEHLMEHIGNGSKIFAHNIML